MTVPLDRSRPVLCFVHDARDPQPPRRLLEVDDRVWARVDLVQVRGKRLPAGELEELAGAWIARLAGIPVRVIVNDRIDVALAAGAHGVHLGQEDLPPRIARRLAPAGFLLGRSTHDRRELETAREEGADYVGLGAFFGTGTKPEARPLDAKKAGLDREIPGLGIPVLAIGGVTPETVDRVFRVPAVSGVAVSASIQEAPDPAASILSLHRALRAAWGASREAVAS